jgi:hypothetical protein
MSTYEFDGTSITIIADAGIESAFKRTLDSIVRNEEESAAAAMQVLKTLSAITGGRNAFALTDRERIGVMILCGVLMRICGKAVSPNARQSAVVAEYIFATAGASSSTLRPPKGNSVMELLDQLQ